MNKDLVALFWVAIFILGAAPVQASLAVSVPSLAVPVALEIDEVESQEASLDYDSVSISQLLQERPGFIIRYWKPDGVLRHGHVSLETAENYLSLWTGKDGKATFTSSFIADHRLQAGPDFGAPTNVAFRFYEVKRAARLDFINRNIVAAKRLVTDHGLTPSASGKLIRFIPYASFYWYNMTLEKWLRRSLDCGEVVAATLVMASKDYWNAVWTRSAKTRGERWATSGILQVGKLWTHSRLFSLDFLPEDVFYLRGSAFGMLRAGLAGQPVESLGASLGKAFTGKEDEGTCLVGTRLP